MTQRVPAADWALIGKLPGDKGDYRILRSSVPGKDAQRQDEDGHRDEDRRRSAGDLTDQVMAAVPSSPQLGSMPGPGLLPWVTFTSRREGGQRLIAVVAIEATADRDAVGRPTVEIRYVSVPFAAIARAGTGYRALHAAIPAGPQITAPLSLDLVGPDETTITALADSECFDRAARLAALLLDGDVVITLSDQKPPSLPERLAEFDRVMTLLPFGMRAGVALASWHDGTQSDGGESSPFRFAYGPFPTHGQVVAAHGEPVPPPLDGPACQYLRDLIALREEFGVVRLAEYLGCHRDPLAPQDTEQACEILRSLAEPRLVVAAARAGRASVERVVNVRRQAGARLDKDARDELETYLLARDDKAAGKAVLDGWSDRTPLLAAALVLGQLRADGTSPAARRLYARVTEQGEQETFLATLAACRTRDGAAVAARSVAALMRRLTTPVRGELPAVRQAVLRQPPLARWLLRLALRGESSRGEGGSARDSVMTWLEWLDPAARDAVPSWLRPYTVLSEPPDAPLSWPVDAENEAGIEDAALVIALLALRDGPMSPLSAWWWPVLLRVIRGPLDEPDARQARTDLIALAEGAIEPSLDLPTAARLDTVRLYLGLNARYLPLARGALACRRYLEALWELWSLPPVEEDAGPLTARLLGDLTAARDVLSADAAVAVLHAVVTDNRIPLDDTIADAIADVLGTVPELAEDPGLTQEWWVRVERLHPEIRTPSARLRATVGRPDPDPVEIAVLCGRSAASGLPPEELLKVTGPWLAGRTDAEIDAILQVLDGVLRLAAEPGQSRSHDEYLQFLVRQLMITAERSPVLRRRPRRTGHEQGSSSG